MKVAINGQPREFAGDSFTVARLLAELGMEGKPVVVELDLEAVLPASYATTEVRDGSRIEIVTIAAGG